MSALKILVIALEPSANLHLREVLRCLKEQKKDFEIYGIFDEALCEEFGVSKPLFSSREFSAMGFIEVLPLIFKAKRAIKELVNLAKNLENSGENLGNLTQNSSKNSSENLANLVQNSGENLTQNSSENSANLSQNSAQIYAKFEDKNSKNLSINSVKLSHENPLNAILCIDSPAFNIPFCEALNEAGILAKKIYYILPQVWAWKKGRVRAIERNFDILASILPFDSQFFSKSEFVGHPLLDEITEFKDSADFEAILRKNDDEKIIAFLPGSRKSEISRLMPIFRDLATNFTGEKILCVPHFRLKELEIYGDLSGFKVKTDTPKVLKNADFAFICSGTATLEAALIGTPFILAYKAKALDVLIARLFVRLKHIGLANIMCDFAQIPALHPEFIQANVDAKALFEAYRKFDFKEFFDKVSFLKKYLQHGAAKNVAQMLVKRELECKKSL